MLHFDTGMNRLGIDPEQTGWLIHNKQELDGLNITYVMSHLVSSELFQEPINLLQLSRCKEIFKSFTSLPASLANRCDTWR